MRLPFDGDVTIRVSNVRLRTFTICSFTEKPAVVVNEYDEPLTTPVTLRAVMVNE